MTNFWEILLEPRSLPTTRAQRPLTPELYPDFFKEAQKLRERIARDYPHLALPGVYVEQVDISDQLRQIVPDYMLERYEDNAHYYGPSHAIGERLSIGRWVIENYPTQTSIAVLAHEYGHFVLNHGRSPAVGEVSRKHECEADHFAVHYTKPAYLGEFILHNPLTERVGSMVAIDPDSRFLTNLVDFMNTHPLSDQRMRALSDPVLRALPPGSVSFQGDCSYVMPQSVPSLAEGRIR